MKNMLFRNKRFYRMLWLLAFVFVPVFSMAQRVFTHPGLSHKQSDLERMKFMVQSGIDPWKTSFNLLQGDPKSSYDYVVRGDASMTTVTQDGLNYSAFSSDALAAYLNALMWAITSDERHAEKAVEIFNSWKNLTCFTGGGTESLNAGRVIWKMLEGAEIIKSTYEGWAAADIQKFKDMLVYPGISHTGKPASVNNNNGTFYWRMYNGDPGRHGNQDLFGWRGVMAIGIFRDDEIMYDRALRYLKGQSHRSDDIPYQAGPPKVSDTPDPSRANDYYDYFGSQSGFGSTPDYGYNGVIEHFIWENGQCQESSRDQDHAILGVGMLASLAEMAWNQGDDLWSWLDNRILKGYEFALRYNVSYEYSYNDQPMPWEPTVANGEFIQKRDRTGRWFSKQINPYNENIYREQILTRGQGFRTDKRPIYEIALAHYGVRMGLDSAAMKWTQRALNISNSDVGFERNGWSLDHLGWGGLTVHRPEDCPGDPCTFAGGSPEFMMHQIPGIIEAEDYDYFTGDGKGKTWQDNSESNSTGQYRTDGGVDIATDGSDSYFVTEMEQGEWMSYTVYVPVSSTYNIKVNYSAASGSGALSATLSGKGLFGQKALPFGGGNSTGLSDFKEFTLATEIHLDAGVQNLRMKVAGESNILQINQIIFEFSSSGQSSIDLNGSNENGPVFLNWTTSNIVPQKTRIYRHTENDFWGSSVIASSVEGSSYTDETAVGPSPFYYWVEIIDSENQPHVSNSVAVASNIGLINEEFNTGTEGWSANTNGASVNAADGILTVQMAEVSAGKWRGDIKRNSGAVLHPGNFPFVAISMDAPQVVNIHLDTNLGSFGNGANKYTGVVGTNVFYYDFTKTGLGSSNTLLSTTNATTVSLFQFKVADVTSGEISYPVYWVKSFRSLAELEVYVNTTGINEALQKSSIKWYFANGQLYLSNLQQPSSIRIVDILGRIRNQVQSATENVQIPLRSTGVNIVTVYNRSQSESFKILVN